MQKRDTHNMKFMQAKHIAYIRKFGHMLTQKQLAQVTGFSITAINDFCRRHSIQTTNNKYFQPEGFVVPPLDAVDLPDNREQNPWYERKLFKSFNTVHDDKPTAPIVRPPAVYDNPSHEDIINKYLTMEV